MLKIKEVASDIVVAVAEFFLSAMGFFGPKIHIGLSNDMSEEKAHGYAWFEGTEGGVTKAPFLVDKPEFLKEPKNDIIRELFGQIAKMGLRPVNLEIRAHGECRVYKYGTRRPLLVQAL